MMSGLYAWRLRTDLWRVRRVTSLSWMGHDSETRQRSKGLYGVTVLLGRARKAERKKQVVPVSVGKIHRFTSCICHGSPGIGRYERVDEWPRGNLPFPRYVHSGFSPLHDWITSWCRAPEEELLYVLHKLLELRFWPWSLSSLQPR